MNINFNLATPQNKKSSIRLIVTHRGKVFRKGTGVSCLVKDWSTAKQKTGNVNLDRRLRDIRLYLEGHLDEMSTRDDVQAVIRLAVMTEDERAKEGRSEDVEIPTFTETYRDYCDTIGNRSYKYMSGLVLSVLGEMLGRDADWSDITADFLSSFADTMSKKGYAPNSIGRFIASIKTVMRKGRKYHNNVDFLFFGHQRTDKKATSEESFSICLKESELDNLWNAQFNDIILSLARDMFVLGVYTASRYSDYSRLSLDNVIDGKIEFVQKKTGNRVSIPCAARVMEIFNRNGGKAPKICERTYRERIKDACRLCGITDVIQVEGTTRKRIEAKEGKQKGDPIYKYELVSTHTARRTGATMLYDLGIPVEDCRKVTGHKSEAQFIKYVKHTSDDTFNRLKDSKFFK